MTSPQPYHNPKRELIAYMFAVEKNGKTVGRVLVGSSAYGYSILEASEGPPLSIPAKDKVSSILRKEHGLQIAEARLGEPMLVLLNILRGFYAVWEVHGQVAGVNLVSHDSFVVPRLKDIRSSMPSPEEYKDAKRATSQSLPGMTLQAAPRGQGWILMPGEMCAEWPDPFLRLPDQHPDRRLFWCGPASATTIALWKRDADGDVGFPPERLPPHDDPPPRLLDALEMFDGFHAAMGGWPWTLPIPWANGFKNYAATLDPPEHFTFTWQDIRRPGAYWQIVSDIDSGWPLALMGDMDIGGKLKPHWVAVEGYFWVARRTT